ncbi:MAG: P-II family nitrogen regulator [Calditrichota bacterium]|jgi:nitrogen regulatory protein P-II 1
MKLLVFILNKEEHLEEILEAFLELNIKGATILDSVGMGSILAQDIPIFAGFKNLMQGSRPANKTILTLIPENLVQSAVKAIEQVVGSLEEPGSGLVFVLDVEQIFGISKTF